MNKIKISFVTFVIVSVTVALILTAIVVGIAMKKQRESEDRNIYQMSLEIEGTGENSWDNMVIKY